MFNKIVVESDDILKVGIEADDVIMVDKEWVAKCQPGPDSNKMEGVILWESTDSKDSKPTEGKIVCGYAYHFILISYFF
jgi:hypothetical protein